jgi:hypothetical protein
VAQELQDLDRALKGLDALAFAERHGGHKESASHRSHEYLLLCPCGSDRLRWNAKKGTWICWGHPPELWETRSGDTLKLIQVLEHMDEEASIEFVIGGYDGGDAKIETLNSKLLEVRANQVRRLPPIPWPRGVDVLTAPCAPHQRAWDYLTKRGVTPEQVAQYRIGYGRQGRLSNYIFFPVYMDRALVFYQARATWDPPPGDGNARKYWVKLTNYRKTLNLPSVGQSARGEEVIFNYDMASVYETVVINEGPFDAVKVGPHAVAWLGKSGKVPHPVKVERLKRMNANRFVIYFDRGREELAAAEALAKELTGWSDVYIVQPPEGYDPGALTPEQNATVIQGAWRFSADRLKSGLI